MNSETFVREAVALTKSCKSTVSYEYIKKIMIGQQIFCPKTKFFFHYTPPRELKLTIIQMLGRAGAASDTIEHEERMINKSVAA